MFSIFNIYPKVAKWKASAKLVPDFWFLILVLVSVSVIVRVRTENHKPRIRNQLHTDIGLFQKKVPVSVPNTFFLL